MVSSITIEMVVVTLLAYYVYFLHTLIIFLRPSISFFLYRFEYNAAADLVKEIQFEEVEGLFYDF